MSDNVKDILEKIDSSYDGVFGKFDMDEENDDSFATALHPIKSRHTEGNRITLSIEDDICSEYANRVEFINERTKPSVMGKPVDIQDKYGFDEEFGRMNNFNMMGVKGGYAFYVARKGQYLFCAELHVSGRPMAKEDLGEFLGVVLKNLSG